MQPNTNDPQQTPSSEQPNLNLNPMPPDQPAGPTSQQQPFVQSPVLQPDSVTPTQPSVQQQPMPPQPVTSPYQSTPMQQPIPTSDDPYQQSELKPTNTALSSQSIAVEGNPQIGVSPVGLPAVTLASQQPGASDIYSRPTPLQSSGKPKKKWLIFAAIGGAVIIVAVIAILSIVTSRVPTVDEVTFEKNLAACKRSITYAPEKEGFGKNTSFKINGKNSDGCGVSVRFGQASNPDDVLAKLSNTSMTCTVDTKNDPEATQLFTDPDKYHCKGTLVDAIKKFDQQ